MSFLYGESEVDAWSVRTVTIDRDRQQVWRRDLDAERTAVGRLQSLGVRRLVDWQGGGTRLDLAETLLPTLVRVLLSEGWRVEADGRLYRRPGAVTVEVRSGIDWFELHGGVDFAGIRADLPALLAAARRGDAYVALGDGTFGLLPDEWLARSGRLAALGSPDGSTSASHRLRRPCSTHGSPPNPRSPVMRRSCACGASSRRSRASEWSIRRPTFQGVLRGTSAMRWDGSRSCGGSEWAAASPTRWASGKRSWYSPRWRLGASNGTPTPAKPSLIVMPRSLVFNWRQEAARFTPDLRVLDFTGGDRRDTLDRFADHDIVLTTYGTLRRDIAALKEVAFDYAILDEAQAIKNARTSTAKAVRLLKADHRLALSGTPIENHLGELWSLFDFLNPGMLGTASIFAGGTANARTVDDEMLGVVARGLRPFILRRTKEQVARELPARTEQTLYLRSRAAAARALR